jgi:hypothetical protein
MTRIFKTKFHWIILIRLTLVATSWGCLVSVKNFHCLQVAWAYFKPYNPLKYAYENNVIISLVPKSIHLD